MKKIVYSIVVTLIMSMFSVGANAQMFSKMPEKKRNVALIKLAREMYKHPKLKEFRKNYGDYGTPSIRSFEYKSAKYQKCDFTGNHDVGKLQYFVTFWCKDKKCKAAEVCISDSLGIAWCFYPKAEFWRIWTCWQLEDKYKKDK